VNLARNCFQLQYKEVLEMTYDLPTFILLIYHLEYQKKSALNKFKNYNINHSEYPQNFHISYHKL